jgi:hypothetical protein
MTNFILFSNGFSNFAFPFLVSLYSVVGKVKPKNYQDKFCSRNLSTINPCEPIMFIQGQFVSFFKQVSFSNILLSIFDILFFEIVTTNTCIYKPTFVYHNQNVKVQFATF